MSYEKLAKLDRPIRIAHIGLNTAGDALGLSRGEREIGFESDVITYDAHPFGYPEDVDLDLSKGGLPAIGRRLKGLRMLTRYDVIDFEYGHSLVHRLIRGRLVSELPALRRMGKTLLATWMGDDARPPKANPWGFDDRQYLEYQARYQGPRRELMLKNAERNYYVNPDIRNWLPGAVFRPYASVDPAVVAHVPPPPPGPGGEITVVHAPSHRGIKGTEHVIAAVESLQADGLPVKLDLVEGLSHTDAAKHYSGAHIAVDQLNIGWYGVYAAELMSIGRPVLCRIVEDEPGDNPFGQELPIVRAGPETVREELRKLVEDRELRERIGAESRAFAVAHHTPSMVARRALEGVVPLPSSVL